MKRFRTIATTLASLLLMAGTLALVQRLVMPKYDTGIVEGNLVRAYYKETTRHDVILVGDCEVYETFSPIALWRDFGITSYIRGSAQQLMWQSYYLLEDTLRTETPKVVVLGVIAMKYDQPQKEAYNRMTIDGMRWSASKVGMIRASMMPEENPVDYLFPLLRYHSRWSQLTAADLRYLFRAPEQFHNGYYMRVDVKPVTTIPVGKKLPDYRFGDNAYAWLDRIADLCEDRGITLLLNKAPVIYPYWYPEWDEQMVAYAQKRGIRYDNFLAEREAIGIDFSTDTYDAGLHLNLSGVEKLTLRLGRILRDECGVPDRRGDPALEAAYAEKTAFHEAMKRKQLDEIARYGRVLGYGPLE